MRFYHCFYTDLPDEFVEANVRSLEQLSSTGGQCSMNLDGVILDKRDGIDGTPMVYVRPGHWQYVHDWMQLNKGKYSGGYWKSLAPDQRDPNRAARYTGRGHAYSTPRAISNQGPGYLSGPSLNPQQLMALPRMLYPWNPPSSPPRPALKREIEMGEITGYRCWKIENGLLRSVYQKDIWYPGKILQGRELEDWGQRGVHSWKQPNSRQFLEYLVGYLAYVADPAQSQLMSINGNGSCMVVSNTALVTGSVILWGDVVEHEYGYRGEFAKVKSLDWLYPSQDMMGRERSVLDNLRTKYGV